MRLKLQTAAVLVIAIGCLLLAESSAAAQVDRTPRRLRIPATVRSFIGGESADSYIFRARQGTTLIVRVSWKREGANYASFIVTDAARDEELPDAKESQDGRRWVGKIPKTGDYLISVGAHPTAQYTLRITLK